MELNKNFLEELRKILKDENILIDEPMKKHTNFKLGGPADVLVIPESVEELIKVFKLVKKENVPYFVIGNGSNLIVRDGGIRGLVLKLEKLKNMRVENNKLIAECGAQLKDISYLALDHKLGGMEFACGIPGSLGGAVFMNAGAYLGEMKQVLDTIKVIDTEGNIIDLNRDELDLSYRSSVVKKKGYIVVEATMELEPKEYDLIKERIDLLTQKREDKQPLEMPSAGSTFKRPDKVEGQEQLYAGKLIEDSGLKGYKHKGAQVSQKHSGFVVNADNAKASDVIELIKHVQDTVYKNYGVMLETEVLIVGED